MREENRKRKKKRKRKTAYTCQASRKPGAVPRLLNDLTYPPRQARGVAALARYVIHANSHSRYTIGPERSSSEYMRECGLRVLVCRLHDARDPHISGTGSHAATHWLQDLTQGWSELNTEARFDALPSRLLLVHAEPAAGQEQGLLVVGRTSCLERRRITPRPRQQPFIHGSISTGA